MKIVFKLCLLLFSLFLTSSFSYANDTAVSATENEQLQKIDKAMSTPVATLNTFVAAMEQVIDGDKQQIERAVSTMDLSAVSSFIRGDRGTQLAYTLYYVIKEGKKPNLKKASSPKTDEYIFVHAGLRDNVSLENQTEGDLLWIRRDFVDSRFDFGKQVVFGHTPFSDPLVSENKIGIDTGAIYGNRLTCLKLPDLVFYSE